MPNIEERVANIERELRRISNVPGSGAINLSGFAQQVRSAYGLASALQGFPAASATLSLPHNDSWLFEDNVDGTHPANLRYVIPNNTQRVVSARLSIKLGTYRTYSSFTVSATGNASVDHTHTGGTTATESATHAHTIAITGTGATVLFGTDGVFSAWLDNGTGGGTTPPTNTENANHSHSGGVSSGQSQTHTHTISGSSFLGVTEGATAAGVTVAFDGVDQTVALGGPFNADMIEINVRPYIGLAQGVWHVIAMQPSGLGRIEAHLRLGVYVSAGTLI